MKDYSAEEMCLVRHLMIHVSPVLVGIKPSLLMGLPKAKRCCGVSFLEIWEKRAGDITGDLRLSSRELKATSNCKQVLFYDAKCLREAVRQTDNADFLEKFGYLPYSSLEDNLDVLSEKFDNREFPHEIGVFLGYPLKDIKGFIRKESLPLNKATRWRVFGDPDSSLELMYLHEKAEMVFRQLIDVGKDPMQFLDKLSIYFRSKIGLKAVSI